MNLLPPLFWDLSSWLSEEEVLESSVWPFRVAKSSERILEADIAPGETLTKSLSEAFQRVPLLQQIVAWLHSGGAADSAAGVCFSDLHRYVGPLEGLLSPQNWSRPGGIIVLPESIGPHLDALLDGGLKASLWNYENDHYFSALVAATKDGVLAIEPGILHGTSSNDDKFFPLVIVCGDMLKLHNVKRAPLTAEEFAELESLETTYFPTALPRELHPALVDAEKWRCLAEKSRHWLVVNDFPLSPRDHYEDADDDEYEFQ